MVPPPPLCAICLEKHGPARPVFETECKHTFHRSCLLNLVLHDLSCSGNNVFTEKFTPASGQGEVHAASLTQHFRTTKCPLCRARIRIAYDVRTTMEVDCVLFGGNSGGGGDGSVSPTPSEAVKNTMCFQSHHSFVSKML